MNLFAPEFSRFWLPDASGADDAGTRAERDDEAARHEREALEALEERVNAARSVV